MTTGLLANHNLSALAALSHDLSSLTDLEALLRESLVRIATLLGGRTGIMMLHEEGTEGLRVAATWNYGPEFDVPRLNEIYSGPLDLAPDKPLAIAFLTRKPYEVQDTREAHINPVLRKAVAESGFRSAVAVPLTFQGKAIGSLGVTFADSLDLDEDDWRTLLAFADQLAFAVAMLRESAQLRKLNERLALLAEVSRVLGKVGDLPELLQEAVDLLCRILGSGAGTAACEV